METGGRGGTIRMSMQFPAQVSVCLCVRLCALACTLYICSKSEVDSASLGKMNNLLAGTLN